MVSRGSTNILDLVTGDLLGFSLSPRGLPKIMTVPGIIDEDRDTPSMYSQRMVIVANALPLVADKDTKTGLWKFSLDQDSLLLQMKDGIAAETEVMYVGSLQVDIDVAEQEEIAQQLLEDFNCVPTFLPAELQKDFYHGFCKQQLWPLFHYMLPICPDHGDRFERSLWQAYVSANKIFADKVTEVMGPDDFVWIHDYHLMILPTFLRKRFNRVKLGFFLHSPFPSSEIYKTLPVRDEILRALLNCDLVGFHTFDYARHFLSCCSRMLGLEYECKRGYIGLDYFGRTVYIKILPVGVHMGRLEAVLNLPSTSLKVGEIREQFKGKRLILGVDDMDIFKGISLKLQAMEQLLQQHPELQGTLVLVQIINPARSTGKDVQEAKRETYSTASHINGIYGSEGYEPVVLIDNPIPLYEKIAYLNVAECCVVNAVRDGMNLVPYNYIVSRQGTPELDEATGISVGSPHSSMLVVSEFVGCSPSLSGAIRVNPWDIDAVADALMNALTISDSEKRLRHEKHYRYVSSHDVAYWARSFVQDLERASKDHYSKRCWGLGFGLGFKILALSPNFRKLSVAHIVSAYEKSNRRAIFLDYDGTIVPQASIIKTPSIEVLQILNDLCNDTKNSVFIVSGRGRDSLSEWFEQCENLGLAAEHGYFIRWNKTRDWESGLLLTDFDWKNIAEPVMRLYTETTDGSYIETKESAMVWHHQDADSDFGRRQALELLDHLENVLANEPVIVKKGQYIVEVKPQGISKGLTAQNIMSTMAKNGKAADFVLCIGDDRSDEDMFETMQKVTASSILPDVPEIFACTVGRKPSKAKYYLDETINVVRMLESLAAVSTVKPRPENAFDIED